MERFIHKMDSMLDEANKLRLRVLVNWDDRVFPDNGEFNMKDSVKYKYLMFKLNALCPTYSISSRKIGP